MPTKAQPKTEEMTLEEALEMIRRISADNEAMEKKLLQSQEAVESQKAELRELTAEKEGYLVTTPLPDYDGITMGIQFRSGAAFLPASSTYPELAGGKRIPTAKQIAQQLVDDFGYTAKFYSYEEMKELKTVLDERSAERKLIENAMSRQQEQMLRSVSRPTHLAGV